MKAPAALLLLICVIGHSPANACSCAPKRESSLGVIQQALRDADVVFVVKLREVKHVDRTEGVNVIGVKWESVTEDARFVVLEMFKGDYLVGQPVLFRGVISAGSCSVAARNDPMWMEEIVQPGEAGIPATFSDTWLVFAGGEEPLALDMCTRSQPLNFADAQQDLQFLRERAKKAPHQHLQPAPAPDIRR